MLGMGIKLTADASGAQRAVAAFTKTAEKQVAGIGKELTGRIAGAFSAGVVVSAVLGFVNSVRNSVDEIKDLSDQLGISTDEVQRLQKAANDTGVKFGVITTALQKIEQKKAEALAGDTKSQDLFGILGIDANASSLEILKAAASKIGGQANENAAAFELIGKKAVIIRNIVAELKAQGGIKLITEDEIAKLDKVQSKLEEAKRELVATAAGPMAEVVNFATNVLKGGGAFAKSFALSVSKDDARGAGSAAAFKEGFVRMTTMLMGDESRNKILQGMGIEVSKAGPATSVNPTAPISPPGAAPVATPAQSAITLGASGDALSRIGLFVGGRPEVGALRNIEANTRETAQATRQLLTEMRLTREAMESN